jgi:hypothetical protein
MQEDSAKNARKDAKIYPRKEWEARSEETGERQKGGAKVPPRILLLLLAPNS